MEKLLESSSHKLCSENLKRNVLHDVPKYIRAIHKISDGNTDHRVTPDYVMKNTMNSDTTFFKLGKN